MYVTSFSVFHIEVNTDYYHINLLFFVITKLAPSFKNLSVCQALYLSAVYLYHVWPNFYILSSKNHFLFHRARNLLSTGASEWGKKMKNLQNQILTSKQDAKHPFAGRNIQQLGSPVGV